MFCLFAFFPFFFWLRLYFRKIVRVNQMASKLPARLHNLDTCWQHPDYRETTTFSKMTWLNVPIVQEWLAQIISCPSPPGICISSWTCSFVLSRDQYYTLINLCYHCGCIFNSNKSQSEASARTYYFSSCSFYHPSRRRVLDRLAEELQVQDLRG